MSDAFAETVMAIHQADPRYEEDAYFFVRDALSYATKNLKKPRSGPSKHVTGKELLGSIREYALHEFGPMTYRVLRTWGLSRTQDFGEIVFNLVESGILGKTDEDRKEDFADGFSFENAFVSPFLPERQQGRPPAASTGEGPDDAASTGTQ